MIHTVDDFRMSQKMRRRKPSRARSSSNKKQEQQYLDFGQKDFGKQITCDICGMFFTQGQPDDEKEVRLLHYVHCAFSVPYRCICVAHAVLPAVRGRYQLSRMETRAGPEKSWR
jgi:hypothetical protein